MLTPAIETRLPTVLITLLITIPRLHLISYIYEGEGKETNIILSKILDALPPSVTNQPGAHLQSAASNQMESEIGFFWAERSMR